MLTIMIIAQPSLQPQYLARRAQIIKKCNFNKSTLILRLLSMNMYALLLVWAMKLILRLALVLSGQKHLRIIFKIYIFLLSRAEDARKNVVGNVREKVQLATHIILVWWIQDHLVQGFILAMCNFNWGLLSFTLDKRNLWFACINLFFWTLVKHKYSIAQVRALVGWLVFRYQFQHTLEALKKHADLLHEFQRLSAPPWQCVHNKKFLVHSLE